GSRHSEMKGPRPIGHLWDARHDQRSEQPPGRAREPGDKPVTRERQQHEEWRLHEKAREYLLAEHQMDGHCQQRDQWRLRTAAEIGLPQPGYPAAFEALRIVESVGQIADFISVEWIAVPELRQPPSVQSYPHRDVDPQQGEGPPRPLCRDGMSTLRPEIGA